MGNLVRLIGTSGGSPPVGLDPLGYIQDWLVAGKQAIENSIVAYPYGSIVFQKEYDGIYNYWHFAQLFATSDPPFASDAFDYAVETMRRSVEAGWPPGYEVYNLGMRMLGQDAGIDPADVATFQLTACQWVGQDYAGPQAMAYYAYNYGDNTWPSATTTSDPLLAPGYGVPDSPGYVGGLCPYRCREFALGIIAHLVTRAWTPTYLSGLTMPPGYQYDVWHMESCKRLIERWFLAPGAAIAKWNQVTADLAAANGDWTQVPHTWYEWNYEYTPFMWAHVSRALIYWYEDPYDDTNNAAILTAVQGLCDAAIDWWQGTAPSGRPCLWYRVYEPGVPDPTSAPYSSGTDLGLFEAPMFAWVYSKTGQQKYYDQAVELIESGLLDGWWQIGKKSNQLMLWAYQGFQWLGWTSTLHTPFWV